MKLATVMFSSDNNMRWVIFKLAVLTVSSNVKLKISDVKFSENSSNNGGLPSAV